MSLHAAFAVPHPPLIVPAVGRGKEAAIQATIEAYDDVAAQIAQIKPEVIVVTSPHATAYQDYFHISPGKHAHGDMLRFDARDTDLECEYDVELADCITRLAADEGFPAGTDYERDPSIDHATYIPLFFIDKYYRDYKVVRIGLSGMNPLEHYHLGQLIDAAIDKLGRRAVLVASGDLSHKLADDGPYGFAEEGPVFDEQITVAMAQGDFKRFLTFDDGFCDKAAECGLRSFQIMAGALDGKRVDANLLSYEGPFGVGYAVASFYVAGTDSSRQFARILKSEARQRVQAATSCEDPYVSLARASVECFVNTHRTLSIPDGLPAELLVNIAGVFVSLHEHGRLRGCIGTISPVMPCIAQEIVRNAISACSEDPRFMPVRPDELDWLEISVDVLSKPEPVASTELLDPQRYGVIVTNGMRRGLLLPLLDGVDTVEQQIEIACRKAGIDPFESGTQLQRFEVVRHEVPSASAQQEV